MPTQIFELEPEIGEGRIFKREDIIFGIVPLRCAEHHAKVRIGFGAAHRFRVAAEADQELGEANRRRI